MQKNKLFHFIFWPLLFCISLILFFNHYYSADEGMALNAAWKLWHGEKMYQDFVEFTTPGSAYCIYWLWLLFSNPSYIIAKLFSFLLWFASAIAFYLIGNKLHFKKSLIIFSIIFWLICSRYYILINHNYLSSFIAVWLIYWLLLIFEKPKKYLFSLLGLTCSLTFLFLQTKGLILFVALLIILFFLFKNNRTERIYAFPVKILNIFIFIFSFILPIAAMLFFWKWQQLFYYWFIFSWQKDYLAHSVFSLSILILAIFIGCLMLLFTIIKKEKILLILFLIQIALFLSIGNSFELSHILIISFPMIFFAGYIINPLIQIKTRRLIYYYFSINILAILLAFNLAFVPWSFSNTVISRDIIKKENNLFNNEEIKAARNIYAGPFLPNYYFELKKNNPFSLSIDYLCTNSCEQTKLKIINKIQPEYAFIDFASSEHLHYSTDTIINRYFRDKYQRCGLNNNVVIFAKTTCPKNLSFK